MTTTAKNRRPHATKPPRVIDAPFVNLDELPDDRLSAARLYEIELYNHSFLAPSPEEARNWAALARAGEKQAREDMVVAGVRVLTTAGRICIPYLIKVGSPAMDTKPGTNLRPAVLTDRETTRSPEAASQADRQREHLRRREGPSLVWPLLLRFRERKSRSYESSLLLLVVSRSIHTRPPSPKRATSVSPSLL